MTQSSIQFFLALCPDKWLALNTYCRCITVCIHKRFSSFFFGGGGICVHSSEGDIEGYPIPQYRMKNWQIPKYRVENGRNTDTAFIIGDAYLQRCIHLACFFFFYLKHLYTRNQPWPSRENMRRSRIDRYNDRKARSLDVLPHHRVTVRNCVFIYR